MRGSGKVVVVGSANIDSTFTMVRLPAAGETVTGALLSEAQGGVGANQALAAARSGAAVELVTAVGADEGGAALLAGLRRDGVGVDSCLLLDGLPTGRAAIWVDRDGENRIAVASGANSRLGAVAVEDALAEVAPPAVVLCQLETPPEAAAAALKWARKVGALGILNASPAMRLDVLPRGATIIVVNEGEARQIAGEAGDHNASPEHHAATIAGALGAETVVVTLGADGASAYRGGIISRSSSPRVDPADTTGAGDAFVGALAARLAFDEPLQTALAFACACGALTTTRIGAGSAIPNAEAVEEMLRST